MAALSATAAPQVILLCRATKTKVDSDEIVQERSTASRWSMPATITGFLAPDGYQAYYDEDCTTQLDAAAAATAIQAVTSGAASPSELADVIQVKPITAPNARFMAVAYLRATAAACAGGVASVGSKRGRTSDDGGRPRKRNSLPWHKDVVPVLNQFVPRDKEGFYLLECDAHGKSRGKARDDGTDDDDEPLTLEQKEMVLRAYNVGGRYVAQQAQQPRGASITDVEVAVSKLKKVASDINTGNRKGGAVKGEDKNREAWVAGTSPFTELKAAFESGTAPPSWAQIESRPLLSEAKAATLIALAAGKQLGTSTPTPGAPIRTTGSRNGATPAGLLLPPPPPSEGEQQQEEEDQEQEDSSSEDEITENALRPSLHAAGEAARGRERGRGGGSGRGGRGAAAAAARQQNPPNARGRSRGRGASGGRGGRGRT